VNPNNEFDSFILMYPTAGAAQPAVFDSVIIAGRATLRFYLPQEVIQENN